MEIAPLSRTAAPPALAAFAALAVLAAPSAQAGGTAGEARAGEGRDAPAAVLRVRATAYTHTEPDHLPYGNKSALGTELRSSPDHHSAAADWSRFPVGTKFRIRGYDRIFVVEDYGSALVGTWTVDIYFPTEEGMRNWGARRVDIEVIEFGSFRESRRILASRATHAHCLAMLAAMTGEGWWKDRAE